MHPKANFYPTFSGGVFRLRKLWIHQDVYIVRHHIHIIHSATRYSPSPQKIIFNATCSLARSLTKNGLLFVLTESCSPLRG